MQRQSFYTEQSFWKTAKILTRTEIVQFLVESKELYLDIFTDTASRGTMLVDLLMNYQMHFLPPTKDKLGNTQLSHGYGASESEIANGLARLIEVYRNEIKAYCGLSDLKRLVKHFGVKSNYPLSVGYTKVTAQIGQVAVMLSHCVTNGEELAEISSELSPSCAAQFSTAVTKSILERRKTAVASPPSAPLLEEYTAPPQPSLQQADTFFAGSGNAEIPKQQPAPDTSLSK